MAVHQVENENSFMVKQVSYSWKNYVVIDKKYETIAGNYWINRIYKNGEIVFEETKKSDVDKTTNDLQKEFLEFMR